MCREKRERKWDPMSKDAPGRYNLAEFARLQWTFPGRPQRLPAWMKDVPVLVEIPLGSGA